MKLNNKGFSLVELIVAIAIMALLAITVSEMMVSGARMYNYVDKDVKVQYEGQLAMSQVESYIIDCNGGVAWDETEGILWVVNVNAEDSSKKSIHTFRVDEGILKYGEIIDGEVDAITTFIGEIKTKDHIAADYLTEFTVDKGDVGINEQIEQLGVGLALDYKGSLFEGEQIFAFRNKIYYHSDINELLETLNSAVM